MKVFAYILVVVLTQFAFTFGTLFGTFVVALLLFWLPERFRATATFFLAGILAVATSVAFGYGVFHLMLGPGHFSWGLYIAATLPLIIPITNDRMKARELAAVTEGEARVQAAFAPMTGSLTAGVAGNWVGLILTGLWFILRA